MKREPNPYASNPILTVTNTMSISVPSMVAEDVIDGTDTPIITTDPEVHGRIDAVSEVVDLMDTRIDAVSEVANLTNTNLYNLAEVVDVINTRVDNVSKVASLGGTSAPENCVTFVDDNDLGEVVIRKEYDSLSFMARTTDKSALAYYSLYAPHFYCGDSGEFEFRVVDVSNGSNVPGLQLRSYSGDWITITGDNSSSSGSSDSGLEVDSYLAELAPTLEFYDGSNYVGLSNVVEGKAGIGLVLKNSPSNYTNAVYPIYTPGLINPSNKDYRLAWLAQNSGEYELKQTTDGGNTWTSLSGGNSSGNSSTNLLYWNYAGNKGESSAMASLVFGELDSPYVFIDNPIAIQGGDNSRLGIRPVNVSGQLNWEACDSYGNWAPISSSTEADDYLTVHGESLEAKYVGATSGKAYSGDNIKTYRLSPKNDTAVIYALQTFLAASGLHGKADYLSGDAARTVMTLVEGATQASTPSILWTTDDGKGFRKWEPWKEGGSSSSASESGRDISFTTSGGTDYSLGFKVNANSNDRSAIVSLTSTGSNEFSGIAALGTWLSAPSYQIGSVGTCMAVSGMGTLVFKHMDDTAIYDLNNLGGGSGSSEGIAAQSAVKFLTVDGNYSTVQGITLQPYYDYGMSNYDSAIIDLKLDTVSGQEFSGIVALRAGMAAPNKSDCDGNVTMEVSGMGVLLFQTQGHYESYDLNNLGGGSGSAAGVYELDLWDNGSDSGSQMLPLVKASNIEAARDVSVLNWTVGTSTSDAADASGMYTLIGNPIALYDSAYRGSNNSRIKGAVRVVDMHGTICWQRYSYTNKQWEIEPTEEILPDGVTMELLPYNPSYEQRKGRLARFTSSDGPLMATAPGIGLYTGNQSIVACLTAKSYDSSTNKTTWKDYYIEYAESTDNGHSFMDITELIGRRQQLCDIASHLSQIRWLCENTAALYALINK